MFQCVWIRYFFEDDVRFLIQTGHKLLKILIQFGIYTSWNYKNTHLWYLDIWKVSSLWYFEFRYKEKERKSEHYCFIDNAVKYICFFLFLKKDYLLLADLMPESIVWRTFSQMSHTIRIVSLAKPTSFALSANEVMPLICLFYNR